MKAGYYAVIFTSKRTPEDEAGYADMAQRMYDLAARQPGFIAVEHAREALGITVSYWESLQSIALWKDQTEHLMAQGQGRALWYESYHIRICKVEREYQFHK
ncbi:antibiotic biosynthesis monooxygenase family protein [Robiginitalea sp.]|jgi:heme-degrading monooxygenase HmoA|uniref:antibiotic biosynthesis monooxygenase family protein n=1 Tax=Robiginitalea sp. TaxID=1902411 RepID=UPI003C792231